MTTRTLTESDLIKEIESVLKKEKGDGDSVQMTLHFLKDELDKKGIECTKVELAIAIDTLITRKQVRLSHFICEDSRADVVICYPAE